MTEQYEQMDIFGSSDLQFAEDTAINLIKTFEPVRYSVALNTVTLSGTAAVKTARFLYTCLCEQA